MSTCGGGKDLPNTIQSLRTWHSSMDQFVSLVLTQFGKPGPLLGASIVHGWRFGGTVGQLITLSEKACRIKVIAFSA